MSAITTAIEKQGAGQAGIARLLGVSPQAVSQWVSGVRPVPPRHAIAIEAATGVSRHDLRPDVFGPAEATPVATAEQPSARAVFGAASGSLAHSGPCLAHSGVTKRALRQRLGFAADAPLAKLLRLPLEQVATWPDDEPMPALPQVLQLLGRGEEPAEPSARADPDAGRIVAVEGA